MSDKIETFIQSNSKWLLTLLFSAGVIYAEFQNLKTVESRLDKKIKVINVLKEEIDKLEIRIVILETKNCE